MEVLFERHSRYPQSSDLKGFVMVRSRQNFHTFTVIEAVFAPQPIWRQKP